MALLTDQAIAEMLAQAQPVPQQVAPAPQAALPVPPPQAFFGFQQPVPQTRFFGSRGLSSGFGRSTGRTVDPFTQQQRYREAMLEQEAERQAQELTRQLSSLDPTAPEAPRQRLNLLTAFPLSQKSDTGKTVLSAWDDYAKSVGAEIGRDKSEDLLGDLAEAGATEAERASVFDANGRVNSVRARRLLGELKRSYEKQESVLDTEAKALEDLAKLKDQAGDFDAASKYRGRLEEIYQSKLPPATRSLLPTNPVQTQNPVAPAAPTATLPTVATPDDVFKLPSGTRFLDPKGVVRIAP